MPKKKSSKAASSTPRAAAKPRESLVVQSKVRERVRALGMRCSGDFVDALSGRVDDLIKAAVSRAKGHNVATLGPRDL